MEQRLKVLEDKMAILVRYLMEHGYCEIEAQRDMRDLEKKSPWQDGYPQKSGAYLCKFANDNYCVVSYSENHGWNAFGVSRWMEIPQ